LPLSPCEAMRHRLDQQHARHDRTAGKMALELRFVGGDVLDSDPEFVAAGADDPVDEQEGIAVRENAEQSLDVVALQRLTRLDIHPRPLIPL
jgi:hypothetical protein